MRNVELTKQRILDAATREFSEYGFAGARVDRIAEQANANKALIYSYFGSKEKLLEAVHQAIWSEVMRELPFDAADLPGYLGRRLDWQFHNPELSRIVTWRALELAELPDSLEGQSVRAKKIELIEQAQRNKTVSSHFTSLQLLALVDSLSRPELVLRGEGRVPEDVFLAYRATAVEALRLLIAPDAQP